MRGRPGYCGNLSHFEIIVLTKAGVPREEIARRADVTPETITHLRVRLGLHLPHGGARRGIRPEIMA